VGKLKSGDSGFVLLSANISKNNFRVWNFRAADATEAAFSTPPLLIFRSRRLRKGTTPNNSKGRLRNFGRMGFRPWF